MKSGANSKKVIIRFFELFCLYFLLFLIHVNFVTRYLQHFFFNYFRLLMRSKFYKGKEAAN